MKKRIGLIIGTRPEAIKLFPVVHWLARSNALEPIVILTGQHREMVDQVLSVSGIRGAVDLSIMQRQQSLADVTQRALTGLYDAIAAQALDFVLVQGDTTTAFAGALAAFYRRVPVGHVEAGLRSGRRDSPYPEEVNRRLVAQVTDLHFAPTPLARDNLLHEGFKEASIKVTGNTVVDALHWIQRKIAVDADLGRQLVSALPTLDPTRHLILVTSHRRENLDGGIARVCRALARIAERADVEVVFPVHPNPSVREIVYRYLSGIPTVHLIEPLGYLEIVHAMAACKFIITDSGGIQEEAPALGKPVLVTRDTTERPEGIAAGTAMLVGTDTETIVREAFRLVDDALSYSRMSQAHNPYGDGKACVRIGRALEQWFSPEPAATSARHENANCR